MSNQTIKRFSNIKGYPGLRKDNLTNNIVATKYINKERTSKSFKTISEALRWQREFHPDVAKTKVDVACNIAINGRLTSRTLKDVWNLFYTQHAIDKEHTTQESYKYLIEIFSNEFNVPINQFSAEYLNQVIVRTKAQMIENGSKRKNFKHPLKLLTTMFNWYKENYDPSFINPVLRRHYVIGKIDDVKVKNKKMSGEEITQFFNALDPFYKDFATIHLYAAGRVSEIAGIQKSSIDFKQEALLIKHVVVWSRVTKKFKLLKEYPKNNSIRRSHINESMLEVFQRRISEIPSGCNFLFHDNGRPLSYRQIQYAYNRALKRAGLSQFSSTHIMRHSMASLTRRVTGSIDATQAVTGHKDIKMVQHYASLPDSLQIEAVTEVEQYLKNLEKNLESKSLQTNKSEQGENFMGNSLDL